MANTNTSIPSCLLPGYKNVVMIDPPPRVYVAVAQTDSENRAALESFAMFKMKQGSKWDDWTNDDFISLCYEPEMLADMTPLERELLARLAGAWEIACNPDAGLED